MLIVFKFSGYAGCGTHTLRKLNLGAKTSYERPEFTFFVNEERE